MAKSDPEDRRAVEAMLAQEGSGAVMLDRPAWEHAKSSINPPHKQLNPGAQLGPYRLEAKIGEGGMGAVYRALDARLNRPVAIKIAAAQFGERFEREAKAIAARGSSPAESPSARRPGSSLRNSRPRRDP